MSCPACGADPDRLRALCAEVEAGGSRRPPAGPGAPDDARLAEYHSARAEHQEAAELAERTLRRAETSGDLAPRVAGLFHLGHALAALGRHADALRHVRALTTLLREGGAEQRFGLAALPYAAACGFGATSLLELGDGAGARELVREGREVAARAGDVPSQHALAAAEGEVLVSAGRVDDAVARLEAAARACRTDRAPGVLIAVLTVLGRALVEAGRAGEAIAAETEALALQEALATPVHRSDQHTILARAWLARGDVERADRALATALEVTARRGERGREGWARLAGATLALRRGDRATAERWADEAQDIAEELGMMALVAGCRALVRARSARG